MRIHYQNVDIAYGPYPVLKNINFHADEGEFIYLIGKVGTGKSSLLKTFYGELDIKQGEATVLDYNIRKLKSKHLPGLRKQLGIVFQDFQLLMERNVYYNLDFVLRATGMKKKKERQKRSSGTSRIARQITTDAIRTFRRRTTAYMYSKSYSEPSKSHTCR